MPVRSARSARSVRAARAAALLGLVLLAGCAHRLSAAQVAVLKQQGFVDKGETWELGLDNKMLFDTDSSNIKPQTQTAVERTGGALRGVNIRNIRVEGYTDNTGGDAHNLELSQRRAQVIANALDSNGATGRIAARGFGKDRPVADNGTEAGRAENRRVAVIVPDNQE